MTPLTLVVNNTETPKSDKDAGSLEGPGGVFTGQQVKAMLERERAMGVHQGFAVATGIVRDLRLMALGWYQEGYSIDEVFYKLSQEIDRADIQPHLKHGLRTALGVTEYAFHPDGGAA